MELTNKLKTTFSRLINRRYRNVGNRVPKDMNSYFDALLVFANVQLDSYLAFFSTGTGATLNDVGGTDPLVKYLDVFLPGIYEVSSQKGLSSGSGEVICVHDETHVAGAKCDVTGTHLLTLKRIDFPLSCISDAGNRNEFGCSIRIQPVGFESLEQDLYRAAGSRIGHFYFKRVFIGVAIWIEAEAIGKRLRTVVSTFIRHKVAHV